MNSLINCISQLKLKIFFINTAVATVLQVAKTLRTCSIHLINTLQMLTIL